MPWLGQLVTGKNWCGEQILFRSEKEDALERVSIAVAKCHNPKPLGERRLYFNRILITAPQEEQLEQELKAGPEPGAGGHAAYRLASPSSAFFPFPPIQLYRVSLCSSGHSGICSVDQAGLEPTEICLPLLPDCWD